MPQATGKVAVVEKLKAAFKSLDTNNDGKLDFKEFFNLLKKGDPDFLEREAEELFNAADSDLSGAVDFEEFVDYIFENKDLEDFVVNLPTSQDAAREEQAKAALLSTSLSVRTSASQAVKARGGDWSKLTWVQRLEEVNKLGEAAAPTAAAPAPRARPAPEPKPEPKPAAAAPVPVPATAPAAGGPKRIVPIAEKTQAELVDYSIKSDDIASAGTDTYARHELLAFKEYLKTAPGPDGILQVKRYLAKGTNGYVFEAFKEATAEKVAMKLVRMTQARTGMKEWYVSKVLRDANVPGCVLTDESVCVMPKLGAPPAVEAILKDAGPVPFYMAMMQEFMNGGSLEGMANEGKLSPQQMFTALADVAIALAGMHETGVQHRDVKPENVMFKKDEAGEILETKVCDFGSAEIGTNPPGEADDIRRFGVTVFSVATMEEWTKNKLIRENHDDLLYRLKQFVQNKDNAAFKRLPEVVGKILGGGVSMAQVAELMQELAAVA